MNKPTQMQLPGFEKWQQDYREQIGDEREIKNRSGIEVRPLYTPGDVTRDYDETLGYPGQWPYTRGIYPTMHRGRTWSQRQLIGLGLPEDYNTRVRRILDAGATAISLIPCNSVYRGLDADAVDREILGTCGTLINSVDDMMTCMDGIPLGKISTAMNDPSPFTMLAQLLVTAERRGIDWRTVTGTSNQSDYLSHFAANHMFFRIALPGARRMLVDHIAHARAHVPGWNPLSVVGQHMQQGGATPAEAMAFTLSSAIQYAEDCRERGLDLDDVLTRFTFFFDISISFFEEIAKFRAGRRIWARVVRERFGVDNPKAQRFKFHGQTSGVDLTRQQPLNNIARVTAQAMAGIFGGLQSLHTDAFDEVLSTPTEEAARIAVASQNILRHEAHLTDVIDPLGGSYYVERLTDRMEEEIMALIGHIDDLGGMYRAVEAGEVQRMMGESAMAFQRRVDAGEEIIVGVNAYRTDNELDIPVKPLPRPPVQDIDRYLARLADYRASREKARVDRALGELAEGAATSGGNLYEKVIDATRAGATQGEIVAVLRQVVGDGQPLIVP